MIQFRLIFLIFLSVLAGCAGQYNDNRSVKEDWQLQLVKQSNWQVSGKLAIIQPKNRQSANLVWQTAAETKSLNLSSFIGTNIMSLTQQDGLATLKVDGETYQDKNAQRLVYQLTGLNLPFIDNPSWLKGLPNTSQYTHDELNRITRATILDEDNQSWLIEYKQYKKHGGYWLPYSMTLSHHDLKLKLKVNTWQI